MNSLIELKNLKYDFDETAGEVKTLSFMGSLSEAIIWENYKNVFSSDDTEDGSENEIVSFSPATQQMFFKFKMRAQSERIRTLERRTELLG